jgi:CO dehydrogenase/acetyl-CoA synthase alpha subunit
MKPSYKDLMTIYYNSQITPQLDWVDVIVVDKFDVVRKKRENAILDIKTSEFVNQVVPAVDAKIRILSNVEVPDAMTSMQFFEKLGMSPTDFSNMMYNSKIENYIGLPKGVMYNDLSDFDTQIITKDEVKSELDERIINIFKTDKPITTLGMF